MEFLNNYGIIFIEVPFITLLIITLKLVYSNKEYKVIVNHQNKKIKMLERGLKKAQQSNVELNDGYLSHINSLKNNIETIKNKGINFLYFTKFGSKEKLKKVTIETRINNKNEVVSVFPYIRKKVEDKFIKVKVKAYFNI